MNCYKGVFRGAPAAMRDARRAVIDFASLCGYGSEAVDDIELAVGEALANAVEHGTKDLGFVSVSCKYDGETLEIEVRDDGPGFEHQVQVRRDQLSIRGFGITIMRTTMDEVRYSAPGNAVRLLKRRLPARQNQQVRGA